jgi:hypothetical protein
MWHARRMASRRHGRRSGKSLSAADARTRAPSPGSTAEAFAAFGCGAGDRSWAGLHVRSWGCSTIRPWALRLARAR